MDLIDTVETLATSITTVKTVSGMIEFEGYSEDVISGKDLIAGQNLSPTRRIPSLKSMGSENV
jgi:hypothetical protein